MINEQGQSAPTHLGWARQEAAKVAAANPLEKVYERLIPFTADCIDSVDTVTTGTEADGGADE